MPHSDLLAFEIGFGDLTFKTADGGESAACELDDPQDQGGPSDTESCDADAAPVSAAASVRTRWRMLGVGAVGEVEITLFFGFSVSAVADELCGCSEACDQDAACDCDPSRDLKRRLFGLFLLPFLIAGFDIEQEVDLLAGLGLDVELFVGGSVAKAFEEDVGFAVRDEDLSGCHATIDAVDKDLRTCGNAR